MSYSCFKLTPSAKQMILSMFPAQHNTKFKFVCDHITHKFPDASMPPELTSVSITGIIIEHAKVLGVMCRVNGNDRRPDGKHYHITVGVGDGVKPVYTNQAIENGCFVKLEREMVIPVSMFVPTLTSNTMPIDRIYVDLDGVITDFESKVKELNGGIKPQSSKVLWSSIHAYERRGGSFFKSLNKMPDADVLLDFIKQLNIPHEFLSAAGNMKNAPADKIEYCELHYPDIPTNIVIKSHEKAQLATPRTVLIDDRMKSIEPWVAAGGIGILHISAEDTIQQLKQLLNLK